MMSPALTPLVGLFGLVLIIGPRFLVPLVALLLVGLLEPPLVAPLEPLLFPTIILALLPLLTLPLLPVLLIWIQALLLLAMAIATLFPSTLHLPVSVVGVVVESVISRVRVVVVVCPTPPCNCTSPPILRTPP